MKQDLPAVVGRVVWRSRAPSLAAIAVVVLLSVAATPVLANCMLVGLGSSMSLITCSGGVRGNAIGLGYGMTSYRLSTGHAGMLDLITASTSASSAGSTSSSSTSGSSTTLPAQPSGVPVVYLFAGASGSPSSPSTDVAPAGGRSLSAPIDQPLMPPMTNVARARLPAPMAPPPRAGSGQAGLATLKARTLSAMIAGG